jgi:hypothetical protein
MGTYHAEQVAQDDELPIACSMDDGRALKLIGSLDIAFIRHQF